MAFPRRTWVYTVPMIVTAFALTSVGLVDEGGDATPLMWVGALLIPLAILIEATSWWTRRSERGNERLL